MAPDPRALHGVLLIALLTACSEKSALSPPPPADDEGRSFEVAFERGLQEGWADWGWCPRAVVPEKPARLQVRDKGGWILARPGLQGPFDLVAVRLKTDAVEARDLALQVGGGAWEGAEIRLSDRHLFDGGDGFLEARVLVAELDPKGRPIERVKLRAVADADEGVVLVDRLRLRRAAPVAKEKRVEEAKVSIDCRGDRPAISPLVYGVAFDPQRHDDASVWAMRPSIRRFGGNPATRFNPKIGAWNTGSDWFFQNLDYTGTGSWRIERLLEDDRRHGAFTSVTMPMLGWVAKDTKSVSFPTTAAQQQASDPWKPLAGNGVGVDGKPLPPPPPSTTSVPFLPKDAEAWARALRGRVAIWHLDNEPDLWHETHRDVHHEPVGYDELLEKTIETSSAIRRGDPDAFVVGPSSWGWTGYFWSAKDKAFGRGWRFVRPDRRLHGDEPLLAWWLAQVAKKEREDGVRLVDGLDVHYYPQGEGLYGAGERTDDEAARRRVRATRALWDPEYVDESWIDEPVMLLPRMHRFIQENAPGKKLVIGEWAFGGEGHVSGALAIAEALGRFATGGVHAAFYWTYPKAGTPAAQAFRAYRDYDGVGGRFLDRALRAEGARELSVFASVDERTSKIVAVLVNLSFDADREVKVDFDGCPAPRELRAFRFAEGLPGLARVEASSTTEVSAPAASITVLEWTLDP